MSDSQVIARKFRPKTFDQVVGQEAITRTLSNALSTGRIHHAYLFTGARGVGKTTTARILAKALNCAEGITTQPCGLCASCLDIAASRSIDVMEMDAASNTSVDNVREVIINTVAIAPARDRHKIFIIDEVHQLSGHAFNALLKTLEEPPPRVIFVMATTELHKVPETILSRCQVFEFRTITTTKIFEQLRRIADNLGIEVSDSALLAISRAGEGSMRDAESSLDQVISFSGNVISDEDVSMALGLVDIETLNSTLAAIAERDAQKVLRIVDEVVSRGYDLRNFCRELMVHTRALLVTKIAGFEPELVQMSRSEGESLVKLAEAFSEQDLVRFFSILTKTEQDIRVTSQPRFQLEIGLMKLLHSRRLYLLEDALNKVSDIQARLAEQGIILADDGAIKPAAPRDSFKRAETTGAISGLQPDTASEKPARPARPATRTSTPPARFKPGPGAPQEVASPTGNDSRGKAEPPKSLEPQPPLAKPTSAGARNQPAPPPYDEPPPMVEDPFEVEPALPTATAQPVAAEREPVSSTGDEGAVEKIKDALEGRRKMMLLSTLQLAESMKLDGEFLRISFSPANSKFKSQVESRDNRAVIEEVCREILGRPVVLSATVGGQAQLETSPRRAEKATEKAAEKANVKQTAENHPAVQAIVDKFHGEVVEVIKPKS